MWQIQIDELQHIKVFEESMCSRGLFTETETQSGDDNDDSPSIPVEVS
jgi:hypothetical protein